MRFIMLEDRVSHVDTGTIRMDESCETSPLCERGPSNHYSGISGQRGQPGSFKVSKRRWLMLLAVFSFGLISGICDMLAPILNIMLKLLGFEDLKMYTWITSTTSYLPLVASLPTAWLVDKWGLKWAIQSGVWLTFCRNAFRALLFLPDLPLWDRLRYVYWIGAHILTKQTNTLFFCLPLKVSEQWFKESERFTAWALMLVGHQIGNAAGAYLLPIYVIDRATTYLLVYVNISGALMLATIVLVCVRESRPPTPPSERVVKSNGNTAPYLVGIKIMLTNRDFFLHLVNLGVLHGILAAISPILEDILASSGYDNHFCGLLISVESLCSIMFLIVSSYVVLLVKNSPVGCKYLACLDTMGLLLFLYGLVRRPNDKSFLIMVAVLACLFKSLAAPTFQNQLAHLCNGIVPEATITGFSMTLVLALTNLFSLLLVHLRQKGDLNDKNPYTDAMKYLCITAVAMTSTYVVLFRGRPPKPPKPTKPPKPPKPVNGDQESSAPILSHDV